MIHPYFYNQKTIINFIIIWVSIIGAHIVLFMFFYELTWEIAIFDALIFNLLFAFLTLPVWWVVKYVEPSKQKKFNLVINHLSIAAILLSFWIFACQTVSVTVFKNEVVYHDLLRKSLPIRVSIGFFLYFINVLIYYLVIYYNDLHDKLVEESRLKELISSTELSLLRSQINPHFLFNSLNSINSLILFAPNKAQEMITKLSDFLRYSISHQLNQFVSLEKEIESVKLYLEIEEIRFSDKLKLEWRLIDFPNNQLVPVMILQPLYENAIKHGVYNAVDHIVISTVGELLVDGYYKFIISNNYEKGSHSRPGAGLGLKNIKERMKILYGLDGLVDVSDVDNRFTVTLLLPVNIQ